MSFVAALALAVGLLVVAPYAAHLLRRRNAEERPFPAARLVPATPPEARRRSALEDRALFAVRAASILALAVLGATPFVNCSHLTLHRESGASIAMAFVLDDSLSMRAPLPDGRSRFERAREAALELCDSAQTGDAIAIVLAGAPARVLLATTSNANAAREALEQAAPSDRAADLDGALQLGQELVGAMPQSDKRLVLFSDLTDGRRGAAPLAGGEGVTLWSPLDDLAPSGADCGIVTADRRGLRAEVQVRCTTAPLPEGTSPPPSPSAGRKLEIVAGAEAIASIDLAAELEEETISLAIPADAPQELFARLTGADLLAEDDVAPVTPRSEEVAIAIVADALESKVDTGGPPPVEQALAALSLGVVLRPLPATPDNAEDLAPFSALIVDDAPGFTPEARRALNEWVEGGGLVLLSLGPRAAAAPLGAGFEPLVSGVVRWTSETPAGIAPQSAPSLGPSAESLHDFAPKGRTLFEAHAHADADVAMRWSDERPLMIRRSIGRGEVWALGEPLDARASDLVLRPAFLVLLERFVSAAQSAGGARRIEVGESWSFEGAGDVKSQWVSAPGHQGEARALASAGDHHTLTADRVGFYRLDIDGVTELRASSIPGREIDLWPRALAAPGESASLGGVASQIDASPYVALLLMGLLVIELSLRARPKVG